MTIFHSDLTTTKPPPGGMGDDVEDLCINKAVRELWEFLNSQGLQAKTIKFEVVNGELKQVDIFGEMKIEMV